MAYTINTGAFAQVRIQGKLFDQAVMNTYYYKFIGTPLVDGAGFMSSFLAGMDAPGKLYATYRSAVSADVIDLQLIGQWVYPFRYRAVRVLPGIRTGNRDSAMTPNVAAVMTLYSDEATRHGVGNKHLPGVPVVDADHGVLLDDYKTAVAAHGNQASLPIADGAGHDMRPYIFNRATPAASFEAVTYGVNDYVRTERRRTVGLGI